MKKFTIGLTLAAMPLILLPWVQAQPPTRRSRRSRASPTRYMPWTTWIQPWHSTAMCSACRARRVTSPIRPYRF